MAVTYSSADIKFKLENKSQITRWIKYIIKELGKTPGDIQITFCSDSKLLDINQEFLKHNTYTDIITFDYSQGEKIEGEIFISIDRVKENAAKFDAGFENELQRVIIHGILHLCGYSDKSPAAKKKMSAKEDEAIKEFARIRQQES